MKRTEIEEITEYILKPDCEIFKQSIKCYECYLKLSYSVVSNIHIPISNIYN